MSVNQLAGIEMLDFEGIAVPTVEGHELTDDDLRQIVRASVERRLRGSARARTSDSRTSDHT